VEEKVSGLVFWAFLGSSDQSGPQGVALDVSADQQKVFIILDGKTL
jgi:hypothetical protein